MRTCVPLGTKRNKEEEEEENGHLEDRRRWTLKRCFKRIYGQPAGTKTESGHCGEVAIVERQKVEQAEGYHARALENGLKKLGLEHVYGARSYFNLGTAYSVLGDFG